MARYTVELNDVIKSGFKLFDFEYDFYNPDKKEEFQQRFIKHFMFREIGQETVGRFKHYLECKFNETLPYYNMLFRTSLMDYEKLVNYSLTDSYTKGVDKVDSVKAKAILDGTKKDTSIGSNALNRDRTNRENGDKTSTLDSTTKNKGTEDITRTDDSLVDTKGSTLATVKDDTLVVGSDTPNGLLSIGSIKDNVYASKADYQDNTSTNTGEQSNLVDSKNEVKEGRSKNITDETTAKNRDTTTLSINENVYENSNGTVNNTGSFKNETDTTQNTIGSENENSIRTIRGAIGVLTESEMLKKHIDLQKTLTTILVKFFDECEDLFMQVY